MVRTMASSPRGQREEERRLNLRTLAIASVASAVAAAVTSQLWIAGTWIAAAITPVLVSLVSELLHRPTEVIARARTSDRRVVRDRAAPAPQVTVPPETARDRSRPSERPPQPRRPDGRAAGRPGPPAGEPDPAAPRPGEAGPVRVYRQPAGRTPRRRIAYGVVAATAAIAFVIGVVALTTTELIAGESVGRSGHRTSIGIGGSSDKQSDRDERDRQPTDTSEQPEEEEQQQQQQQQEQRQPAETDEEEQPPPTTETTPTTPTVPEEEPPTDQTAPRQTPAPPQTRTAPAP
jgi:hypothetical protein